MRRLVCHFCGQEVGVEDRNTYRRITGWVGTRTGGGPNAIRLASPPQAFAHSHCLERELHRGAVQGDLFHPRDK